MTAIATPVCERPILFSGEMVRAIRDGRKTQTRRVLTAKNLHRIARGARGARKDWGDAQFVEIAMRDIPDAVLRQCPYGQPGDRLWVRETWHCPRQLGGSFHREKLIFKADERFPGYDYSRVVWASPIHMPRWASRITLEITGLRVERIRDISAEDCRAEGVDGGNSTNEIGWRYSFGALWNSINEARGFDWNVNPWVWVIEFRRLA